MATEILSILIRVNLAAAAAILAVLFLRRPVRAWFGARAAYGLWIAPLLAVFALLVPAPRTPIVLPSYLEALRVASAPAATIQPKAPDVRPAASNAAGHARRRPSAPTAAKLDFPKFILCAWIVGAVLSLGFLLWRQRRFLTALGSLAVVDQGDVRLYRATSAKVGPAVVGMVSPRIVIPADFEARFTPEERQVVLAHEHVHLAHQDSRINGLVALSQCLNWFNPLTHVAAFYLRLDQELACDAAVVSRFPTRRRRYAEALMKTQMTVRPLPMGCYWPARSRHPLNTRIAMLKGSGPSTIRRLIGCAAVVVVGLGAGFAAWATQSIGPAPVLVHARLEASARFASGNPISSIVAASKPAASPSPGPIALAAAAPVAKPAIAEPSAPVQGVTESALKLPDSAGDAALVLIPSGEFTMGATEAQKADFYAFPGPKNWNDGAKIRVESSGPAHVVNLSSFYIFKFDVTNRQYQAFVAATGHKNAPTMSDSRLSGPDQPTVGVSWNDANMFCAWAGGRLPTEAEWEKAARGTKGFVFPWGNTWDRNKLRSMDGIANQDLASIDDWQNWRRVNITAPKSPDGRPVNVGSYPAGASPYGVMDMAGNVWEWVADWWDPTYYAHSPRDNPKGPTSGDFRVLRGGAWDTPKVANFSWYRETFLPPSNVSSVTGFRCAKDAST